MMMGGYNKNVHVQNNNNLIINTYPSQFFLLFYCYKPIDDDEGNEWTIGRYLHDI